MDYKKRSIAAIAIATASVFLLTGIANGETASPQTATSTGGAAYGIGGTASWAVKKRANVRQNRPLTSTWASSSEEMKNAAAAYSWTKNLTNMRKSARGTWSVRTATGMALTGDMGNRSAEMDARTAGIIAWLGMAGAAFQAISLAIMVFFGFCLYKIASKLGEPHAWLGFIPYVQTYTFVKAWGKSGWWVLWITLWYLAFFIPGFILTVVVLHGISKRYGRGVWTTILFVLFPYVMFPVLAFSEPKGNGTVNSNAAREVEIPAAAVTAAATTPVVMADLAPKAPASVFVPETPAPEAPMSVNPTAGTATSIIEPSDAATTETLAKEAPSEIEGSSISAAAAAENPITKEAEKIVDSGPGFKLPGA